MVEKLRLMNEVTHPEMEVRMREAEEARVAAEVARDEKVNAATIDAVTAAESERDKALQSLSEATVEFTKKLETLLAEQRATFETQAAEAAEMPARLAALEESLASTTEQLGKAQVRRDRG